MVWQDGLSIVFLLRGFASRDLNALEKGIWCRGKKGLP